MRCCCCNANLSDYESTLKSASTGQYLDMCRKCLKDLDIPTLKNSHDPDTEVMDHDSYWDDPDVEFNEVITFDDDE